MRGSLHTAIDPAGISPCIDRRESFRPVDKASSDVDGKDGLRVNARRDTGIGEKGLGRQQVGRIAARRVLLRKGVHVAGADEDLIASLVDGRLAAPHTGSGPAGFQGKSGHVPEGCELSIRWAQSEASKVSDEVAALVVLDFALGRFLARTATDEDCSVLDCTW